MPSFADFHFPDVLMATLKTMGYETPTPVQEKAIPILLAGRDLLATAQTGTGKTAAFALPLLSNMIMSEKRDFKQALIVAPTRELAEQIGQVLEDLTQKTPALRVCVVIGGTSFYKQVKMLKSRPAFVVGTPGRLIDQIRESKLDLRSFGSLVIDEADRLLDMGFEPQMNEIVENFPRQRQTMLFSATLPPEIQKLATSYMKNPERLAVGAVAKPVDKIKQDVVRVKLADKPDALIEELKKMKGSAIVFVKTKLRVERVAYLLKEAGHKVTRIHGDRSQAQRSQAIDDFRSGVSRILVATDIAARGLDVPHIQHVINFDLPLAAEDYVHRIGRTARAGAEGHSLAFVTPEEEFLWAKIHKLMYGVYPTEFRKPGQKEPKGSKGVKTSDKMNDERYFKRSRTERQTAAGQGGKRPPREGGGLGGRVVAGKKKTGLPFKREEPASGNRAERRAQLFTPQREFGGGPGGPASEKRGAFGGKKRSPSRGK